MTDKPRTLKTIEDNGLVAVIRADTAQQAAAIARAVADGGVVLVEITMTVPDAIDVIRETRKCLPDNILLGAGTVMDGRTARLAIEAGADFIVSPILEPDIVKVCKKSQKVSIPGAFTPSEIIAAVKAGADIVKIFPASLGGPELIKDLRGPFPCIKLLPTGGITLENAGRFIKAGAIAVAVGGNMVDKKAVASGDYQTITETARKFSAAVKEAMSSKLS